MSQPLGLVADIGRQSVCFALTADGGGGALRNVERYSTAEHPSFTGALVDYLQQVGHTGDALPSVLAIAGAVRGDTINLTGSQWYISLRGVEAVLRRRPVAVNDTAASALALATLPPEAFGRVGTGATPRIAAGGTYVVISPGTGLGVAALATAGERLTAIQSEAGHIGFAPRSDDEKRLCELLARTGSGHPSVEAVLSAGGLVAAYRMYAGDVPASVRAEDVTRAAVREPHAAAAVRLFVGALGAVAGDLALAFGAWDGILLTGSLIGAITPRLAEPNFRQRLTDKRAFARQLGEIPVAVVQRGDLELAGAATLLAQMGS